MRISDWSSDVCSSDLLAIRLVAETEVPRQRLQQLAHVRGIEEVRRAAAEVQLAYRPVAVEQRRDQLDLAVQSFKVTVGLDLVAGDFSVSAEVDKQVHPERDVTVQRKRPRGSLLVGRPARHPHHPILKNGPELSVPEVQLR